jgi:cytochrome o ubiquinol oxidase subunit II
MSSKTKVVLGVLIAAGGLIAAGLYLSHSTIPVLQARGPIAKQERDLIIFAAALSLIVVIPVYAMLIGFAWRYREGNKRATYSPSFTHSRKLETIWWGVPLLLIAILSIVTWRSSNRLDPFRPINPGQSAMTIQVVSMQWKWLFIYPKQGIASVNYAKIPLNTPIDFQITSDAAMNSFWVPQLGGQIYAMGGMATHLHLLASQAGDFRGSSANISGDGFAGMRFTVSAASEAGFLSWVDQAKSNQRRLDINSYGQLSKPSFNNPVRYYGAAEPGLFDRIVAKYQAPLYFKPEEAR